ncbi:MAG TPA: class I tRNA ligase family protein, partial [Pyrinomonadaceae bacterium]
MLNSEGAAVGQGVAGDPGGWALHDRWIVSRLNKTARAVDEALAAYQFHEAVYALYHFFWDDFCDWYIELSKADVTAAEASPERDAARSRALTVLERALRLLHPFMPFITEELWARTAEFGAKREGMLIVEAWPRLSDDLIDPAAE